MKFPVLVRAAVLLLCSFFASGSAMAAYDKLSPDAVLALLQGDKAEKAQPMEMKVRRALVAKIKNLASAIKLPPAFKLAITPESIYPDSFVPTSNFPLKGSTTPWRYYLLYQDGLVVELIANALNARMEMADDFPVDEFFLDCWRYDLEAKDLIGTPSLSGESALLNPSTAKPYFTLPEALLAQVKDKEQMLRMHGILSQNVAAMMSLTRFDKEQFVSGDLFGKFLFYPQLRFGEQKDEALHGACPEDELALRADLGYLLDDALALCAEPGLSLRAEGKPIPPVWHRAVGLRRCSFFTQADLDDRFSDKGSIPCYTIRSCKDYSQTLEFFLMEQVKEHFQSLSKMQEGLLKLAKEAGVEPSKSPKASSLSAEQQILLRWCYAMDYYMLRLKARRLDLITRPELLPLLSLAPYVGTEQARPISEADKEAAEEVELTLDKKRESWRKRVAVESAKRDKEELKKLQQSDKAWAKANDYTFFGRRNGGYTISK